MATKSKQFVDPNPDSMGSRIQEGKNDPEKFKTAKINFIF
jgi:hypothetical protein